MVISLERRLRSLYECCIKLDSPFRQLETGLWKNLPWLHAQRG
ncbi:hypothetical protein PPTG_07642 [Phytophthora nicotianae INRA-310]|uniref:Uncharacterized protein n=1 Tax=Phytophthora nicotianae (strain INRA-310) TaxID=761204 RepID=W2QN65_PHYN3|nr:hypothetical protein PPTG_07642 [Phytophthora nicotianae INRA-310]ETN14637.1 hypothetical protein PPTG_07642 [Phytophthora nicotianae INRA-310]